MRKLFYDKVFNFFLFTLFAFQNVYSSETPEFDLFCESPVQDFRFRVFSSTENSFIQTFINHDENFHLTNNLNRIFEDFDGQHPGYFLILRENGSSDAASLFINTTTSEVHGSIIIGELDLSSGVNCHGSVSGQALTK
jgi:hypothetical protein